MVLAVTCGPWGSYCLEWAATEGGELGRRGQVSKCELSWETHGAGGTLGCWMVLGGWRASFPLVASDHRHYPRNERKENMCFLGAIKTFFSPQPKGRKNSLGLSLKEVGIACFLVSAALEHVIFETVTHLKRKWDNECITW